MILPLFEGGSLRSFFDEWARILRGSDEANFKKGQDVLLLRGERIILKAPDGGRWALVVDNTGALSTEAA